MAPARNPQLSRETSRRYHDLEDRFRAQAEADGDIYLPNVEPSGPVDYVFIAMAPSLGHWARTPQEARAKVEAGFRNFVADEVGDVVLLHHAIRHYLCREYGHIEAALEPLHSLLTGWGRSFLCTAGFQIGSIAGHRNDKESATRAKPTELEAFL